MCGEIATLQDLCSTQTMHSSVLLCALIAHPSALLCVQFPVARTAVEVKQEFCFPRVDSAHGWQLEWEPKARHDPDT